MNSPLYLLDTNICIFLLRRKYDIAKTIQKVGIENCFISEITLAELYYGAECSSNPDYNLDIISDLKKYINISPISETLQIFAKQKARLRKEGVLIDDFDLLIGSTAIFHNAILVTDNIKHMKRLPIKIENWVER